MISTCILSSYIPWVFHEANQKTLHFQHDASTKMQKRASCNQGFWKRPPPPSKLTKLASYRCCLWGVNQGIPAASAPSIRFHCWPWLEADYVCTRKQKSEHLGCSFGGVSGLPFWGSEKGTGVSIQIPAAWWGFYTSSFEDFNNKSSARSRQYTQLLNSFKKYTYVQFWSHTDVMDLHLHIKIK